MTFEKVLLASIACAALAACAPATKDAATDAPLQDVAAPPQDETADSAAPVEPAFPEGDACNAATYQSLVGTNVAAISLPADLLHRIYKDGDPVTMDYSAERLNIVTDENGVVIEVKCG